MTAAAVGATTDEDRIDALAPVVDGVYRDHRVEVRRGPVAPARRSLGMVRTPHFDVSRDGHRTVMTHRVPPDGVDDDLAGLLARELFAPGWLRGSELFERLFTGVVLTTGPDPLSSWHGFYANTLRHIDTSLTASARTSASPTAGPGSGATHGTIDDRAPVYAHAERCLAPGSVLELGCCFGFLSLRLAATGREVVATDLNQGTVALLAAVSPLLGLPVTAVVADAARVPAPDDCADTVVAAHLLEHLDAEHGDRVLAEALRLARRRVVVAVPLEDEADETWGHVRTLDLGDLAAWGRRTGLPHTVTEHHGGWLCIDLPDAPA